MRRECTNLRQRLAAVDQICAAYGNFYWPEWVTFVARRHNQARVGSPGFIGLRPGWIENDRLCFAEAGGQRELLIADADLVRLHQCAVAKDIHAESRNVDYDAGVLWHCVRTLQEDRLLVCSCLILPVGSAVRRRRTN